MNQKAAGSGISAPSAKCKYVGHAVAGPLFALHSARLQRTRNGTSGRKERSRPFERRKSAARRGGREEDEEVNPDIKSLPPPLLSQWRVQRLTVCVRVGELTKT